MIKMKQFFGFLRNVIREYRSLIFKTNCMIESKKMFLLKGVYKTNGTVSSVYNKNFKSRALKENRFIWKENCKKSIKRDKLTTGSIRIATWFFSVFYRYKLKSDGIYGQGQILIISTLKKDIKIIDYNAKAVYTIFDDKNRMDFILEKRSIWQKIGGGAFI